MIRLFDIPARFTVVDADDEDLTVGIRFELLSAGHSGGVLPLVFKAQEAERLQEAIAGRLAWIRDARSHTRWRKVPRFALGDSRSLRPLDITSLLARRKIVLGTAMGGMGALLPASWISILLLSAGGALIGVSLWHLTR